MKANDIIVDASIKPHAELAIFLFIRQIFQVVRKEKLALN